MNTIIYLTDNSVNEEIGSACRNVLAREAGDIPIISVSQKPIAFGENVCVGEIGRSWYSLYRQLLAGLERVKTDWVVIAEHDCLYSYEALQYQPSDPNIFWYNGHHWLLEWSDRHPNLRGMFSYWPHRTALSQLVCCRDLLRESVIEMLTMLDMGLQVDKGLHFYGEPGCKSEQFRKAFIEASSGRPTQLQAYLKDYVSKTESRFFRTAIPSIDIRHNTNFTGGKRGGHRCYTLPYWGTLDDIIRSASRGV